MTENAEEESCEWAGMSDLMRAYHDREWGVPVRDDRRLFEYLILDGFQAGLSWHIILRKREAFRRAFRDFEPGAVAAMTDEDLLALLADASIVRNRAKILAARENARAFLEVGSATGSFAGYFWSFAGGRTIQNQWRFGREVPAETDESRAASADLRKRGFTFVGPTIVYAVMQSAGLVNDHVVTCFRHAQLTSLDV